MKKHLLACLLALPVAALHEQAAFAWAKFNFGIGANIGYQSGGNKSLLWGLWSSSDTGSNCGYGCNAGGCNPGCCAPGYCGPMGCGGNYGGLSGYPAGFQAPGPQQIGPFGQDFSEGWMSPLSHAKPETTTPEQAKPAAAQTSAKTEPSSNTQPVGAFYYVPQATYAPSPYYNYYYPSYNGYGTIWGY